MADMKPLGFSMMPIKIEVDPTDGSRKVIAIDTTGHGLGEPEKTLTTRKTNTTGLKEGEVGMMPLGVGRKPLAVKYLGEKSYKETLALADEIIGGHPRGQLIAYARAEGIPPGQILHPKVLNKFFGTKRNKNAHLFELAAADPFAGRNQLHPTSMKCVVSAKPIEATSACAPLPRTQRTLLAGEPSFSNLGSRCLLIRGCNDRRRIGPLGRCVCCPPDKRKAP